MDRPQHRFGGDEHLGVYAVTEMTGGWIVQNEEVLYAPAGFSALLPGDIAELKRRAALTARRRCRICLHDGAHAALHDMVIVQGRGIYARPHRHLRRPETLIVLEGEGTFVRFTDDGRPTAAIPLSASGRDGTTQVLRVPTGEYHGLTVESEWLVICESTLGPFDPNANEFAPWAPPQENVAAVRHYLDELKLRIAALQ
jgi:cupin fold WbuC family metalloprotein